METSKTRSTFVGLPPRELLASFGLPPDALDLMMDDDEMALRVLVLTRDNKNNDRDRANLAIGSTHAPTHNRPSQAVVVV